MNEQHPTSAYWESYRSKQSMDPKKRCPRCKRLRLKRFFYRNRARGDGLDSYCKGCRKKEKRR